jgi:hypothetical protein
VSLGEELRTTMLEKGVAKAQVSGWSIFFTGGPKHKLGGGFRLSGKRLNGGRPNALNLAWLRQVAVDAGAPEVDGRELIVGTWHWSWDLATGIGEVEDLLVGNPPAVEDPISLLDPERFDENVRRLTREMAARRTSGGTS